MSAISEKPETIRYSDLVRFFEVYPEVSYIFDNTMSNEVYSAFISNIIPLIQDKKFPTEDVCKVFNILIRISAYFEHPENDINDRNLKFIQELVGRLRHSIYDIPKD